jgi:D-alanyl-D-alanine carboxypeptidase (penicillin-binding protein 5/6)
LSCGTGAKGLAFVLRWLTLVAMLLAVPAWGQQGASLVAATAGPRIAAKTPVPPKPERKPVRLPEDSTFGGLAGPALTAKAAVLMDFRTGDVLFSRKPLEQRPPASLTKMVSALLIAESGRLDRQVTVSRAAAAVGESSIALVAGERLSLRDLLDASLIKSANDATTAAAEAVAGSERRFVELMNQKAQQLGAARSHFVNPHGLHHPQHYSCAMDMAIIAQQVMRDPLLQEIVATRQKTLPWPGHKEGRVLPNRNRLLGRYEYADGVKTGYTRQAGRCLAASATKQGRRLIAVLLDAKDAWAEAQELLEWGFGNYRLVRAIAEGQRYELSVERGIRPVVVARASGEVVFVIARGNKVLEPQVELCVSGAPIAVGDRVATATVETSDGRSATVDLIAVEDLPEQLAFRVIRVLRANAAAVWVVAILALGVVLGVRANGASAKAAGQRRRGLQARLRGADPGRAGPGEWGGRHAAGHPGGPPTRPG